MTQGRRGQVVPKQLPDGRWRANVRLGTDPATGRPLRPSVYGRSEQEVMDEIIRLQYEHRRGLPVERGRQRLDAYMADWLATGTAVDEGTWRRYETLWSLHLKPRLGRIRLDRLTQRDVRVAIEALLTAPRAVTEKGEPLPPLAPATVRQAHAVLRVALAAAVRDDLVPRNVAALVKPPPAARPTVTPFTANQAAALLTAVRGDRLEGLIAVALALGLRQGEAIALRWSDVDLVAGRLVVRWQVQRRRIVPPPPDGPKTRLTWVPTKSRKQRTLTLPAPIVTALERQAERNRETRALAGRRWVEHQLVFPSSVGTPIESSNLIGRFDKQLKVAKLPDRRFHDLRHTAAALLLAQGVGLNTVKEILGHSQISITADTYGHILDELHRDAADRMGALFDRWDRAPTATGGQTGG